MGAWVEASVAGEAILAEAEVGAEQEADRRINAAQNERFRRVMYRFTNHIVSENLLINRENNLFNENPPANTQEDSCF
jgi:hypothetical protein